MLKLLRQMGVEVDAGAATATRVARRRRTSTCSSAVRNGQDHARVDPGARPAAGALRRSAGVAAGRLRDRRAAGRPAHQGPAGDGRRDHRSSTATSTRSATRLKGARIVTDMITVTGTENLLMAAALAEGETVIENAAREPEVDDLALLIAMGAKIEGHRHRPLRDPGRREAAWRRARVSPTASRPARSCARWRRPAATSCCATCAPRSSTRSSTSCAKPASTIERATTGCASRMDGRPSAVTSARTEYPAFPTDMQAQFMALNSDRRRHRAVTETIFENRFMHVQD